MKTRLVVSAALLAALCGCASFNEDMYEYQPKKAAVGKPAADTCYVMPVIDVRPIDQRDPMPDMDADILVSYVPLWPYSKSEINPLPRYDYFRMDLQDMVQSLVSKDLRFSGIFREVKTVRFDENSEKPGYGYSLRMSITKCVWERYVTTYGLALAGPVLWSFGAPISYGSVSMEIDAQLVEVGSRNVVAKGSFKAETPCTEFFFDQIYYMPSRAEGKLTELFPDICSQLREFLIKGIPRDKVGQ